MSATPIGPSVTAAHFEQDVLNAVVALRASMAALFARFPGGVRKSRDAQKHLSIDAHLSWQVLKLMTTPEPLAAAKHVPSPHGCSRLCQAARSHGIPDGIVSSVEHAAGHMHGLIQSHAGNRQRFQTMVGDRIHGGRLLHDRAVTVDNETLAKDSIKARKDIHLGHMHYYGMDVETRVVTNIVGPDPTSDTSCCHATVRSYVGLQRLQADANMLVDRFIMRQATGKVYNRSPLDPVMHAATGSDVMAAFSSNPLPELTTHVTPEGETRTVLVSPEVGRDSRVNLTFGNISKRHQTSGTQSPQWATAGVLTRVWLPTRLLVVHLLVDADRWPRDKHVPKLRVTALGLQADPGNPFDDTGTLPMFEQPTFVGTGPACAHVADQPQHPAMLAHVQRQTGWDLAQFDVYRLVMPFPMLNTMVSVCLHNNPV